MKNIGILVVFLATVFLSTKSIWAKLIYLDSLSPLNVLVCRAVLSLPFFLIPMIRFDWNSVNKSKVFKYSFLGAILYVSSSITDFIGLLYICLIRTCCSIYISNLRFSVIIRFITHYIFKSSFNCIYCARISNYV